MSSSVPRYLSEALSSPVVWFPVRTQHSRLHAPSRFGASGRWKQRTTLAICPDSYTSHICPWCHGLWEP